MAHPIHRHAVEEIYPNAAKMRVPMSRFRAPGTRNITARPNRKLFFGVGNWFYPRSRVSVGIWILQQYARKLNLTWDSEPQNYCATAESEHIAMVKPTSYWPEENGRSFISAAATLRTPFDRCVVMYANVDQPFGEFELSFGPNEKQQNPGLYSIVKTTGTENFARLSIGVGYPTDTAVQGRYLPTWSLGEHDYVERALLTKFPPKEEQILDTILMPVIFEMMEAAEDVTRRQDYQMYKTIPYNELEEMYAEAMEKERIQQLLAEKK